MAQAQDERRQNIEMLIMRNDEMKVIDIAKELNVTPETIRTDLDFLERKGVVTRSHGKARLRTTTTEAPMTLRMSENADIKREISEQAFKYIQDGMMIYLTAGSTLMYIAKLLTFRKNVTIYTNSIDIVEGLTSPNNKVILVGGAYRPVGRRMNGAQALQMLRPLHYDLAIFGFDGSLNMEGPGSLDIHEMELVELVRKNSMMNILIGDHTKFEKPSYCECGKWNEYDVLVTDYIPRSVRDRITTKTIIETNKNGK